MLLLILFHYSQEEGRPAHPKAFQTKKMGQGYILMMLLLLSKAELIRGRTNPSEFYSTFSSNTYRYQSDFSKHNSFMKLRDHLKLIGHAINGTPVVILDAEITSVRYYGLQYHLTAYEDLTEPSIKGKLCYVRAVEIKELSDIFFENLTQPVKNIFWTCPAYSWCCGAECCQHYYKSPWAVLGPDLYGLIAAGVIFITILIVFELFRRWRKKRRNGDPVPTSTPFADGSLK